MRIISSIVGGLSKLAIAKILDTIGRPQGMALALTFWVMGMVMMAACKNVETYAAAQVFAQTGRELLFDHLHRRYNEPPKPTPHVGFCNIPLYCHHLDWWADGNERH
ncbi:hypothetical protein J3459_007542 [Metarhizium acridum]|uniref:uncharacterized protein n=1 Tax=Metarhizium acridum TaxID=92637 RepID=UPI001C6A99E7|nr:hypothetical protein J3458_003279 [Metarhizium acridum]KAG8427073.1 hypothetical protein J3459_007542 [Metarhizium acridum]